MALNGKIFAYFVNGFCNPLSDSVLPPPFNTHFARSLEFRGECLEIIDTNGCGKAAPLNIIYGTSRLRLGCAACFVNN